MYRIKRLFAILAGVVLFASCADKEARSYNELENLSFKEWMKKYHSDLVENYQEDGAYYIDVINLGDGDKPAVKDTTCWVRLEFTGRDLGGNICVTRDELRARQVGSFTKYTHYVPLYRLCGENSSGGLIDGLHRAMSTTLKLGDRYAADNNLPAEFDMRIGTELDIYMPSSIVGSLSASGGYEGQLIGETVYTLSSGRPLIAHVKIVDIVKNPLEWEGGEVDAFAEENGTLKPVVKDEDSSEQTQMTRGEEEPQYNDGYAWRSAVDSIPQLYINHTYKPSVDRSKMFKYRSQYLSALPPYNDLATLEEKINEKLLERFGEGTLKGDSVKMDGTARIWYIGRFLDGFIFDTNIDEVKELIYGKVESTGTAISITAESDKGAYVDSWYYSIPQLRFGQWACVLGISTYNYGSTGKTGETTVSTSYDSSYYDMINYYNYMNSYYGNSYYGGYYNNYYDSYYYGYYDDYYYSNNYQQSSTTVTTISTEIQSYTPLLFQIYIEEED